MTRTTRAHFLAHLLASTALVAAPGLVMAGDALPTNPRVTSGEASIATSGAAMTISQGSDRAIVNWQGFSIGDGNSVTIHQPGARSAILNRVTGSTSSTIAGRLSANGQVLLVNPNGIAITSTGAVNVGGGFIGSTLDIRDEDFLKGDLTFKGKGASAPITNDGVITVGSGGYAALLGGSVRNDGRIAVPLGKVGLGAGERITLDLSGDGFMQVALPSSGKDSLQTLIDNGGTISADGGYVILAAATAQELARKAINMDGLIQARSVSGQNGAIVLGGGAGGTTAVSGTLDASGVTETGGTGGSITVTGQTVALTGATLDASGTAGGGSVRVGGDWHGEGSLPTAKTTTVDAATTLKADAMGEGNGGSVVLWSDKQTTFQGAISARGAGAGRGGNAEVSGKAKLAYQGVTDLSSEDGTFGTLLLDPYNVTISDGADTGGVTATGDDSVINVSTLQNALALASVTVSTGTGGSQNGDITLANALSWSANTTLTLAAAGAIAIDANLTASGTTAGLVLTTGAGKDYSIASGASITLSGSGATLAINGTDYTLIHDMAALDAIDTTGLGGAYALAGDLTAPTTPYDHALVGVIPANAFTGTFAGLGHTITDLTIENTAATTIYWGLFGVNKGTIRDIGLVGGSVTATGSSQIGAGGLAGLNYGTITNATATGAGAVTANSAASYTGAYAGGLVGYNSGTITNATATGAVTANSSASYTGAYAGGLVGYNSDTITNATATGAVTAKTTSATSGNAQAGGLVGFNSGTITNATATGAVTATNTDREAAAGGFVGQNYNGTITNAYATGAVTATTTDRNAAAGGFVGQNYNGTITNAYATGAATASTDGAASTAYAGGFVGDNKGTITKAYATGNATASAGAFTAVHSARGFAGFNDTGTITQSYWDTTTSGLADGGGSGTTSDVTGLTTAQFQNTDSFMTGASGWDFDTTWAPPSSGFYPQLYALTPVLYVKASAISMTYGDSLASPSQTNLSGGPVRYVFGPSADTIYTTLGAGAHLIPGAVTSDKGVTYRVIGSGGTLTVDPRAITVTADNQSRTYGDANPTLTYKVTSGFLVSGDSLSGALTTAATTTSAVGTYDITKGSLAASPNYTLSYTLGTLTINKRAITVTADNQSRTYGDANPTLTYKVTSGFLVSGDSLSGALTTAATATSPEGTYDITQGSLAASLNYTLSYQKGILTVAARPAPPPPPAPAPTPEPTTPTTETPTPAAPAPAPTTPTPTTSTPPVTTPPNSVPASIIANAIFTNDPLGTFGTQPQATFDGTGEESGGRTVTEDPRLSGPVCFMGAGQALSCGAN
ncbi:beta strand repeat-containing protein [Rhodospirillum sp. A1_3_36]|uniref:beta strand repeat-containing protein n=1 Tax=Rhodospirillum sp. A1_3_36 TaxID=3391666 RepID=UPI0039A6194C